MKEIHVCQDGIIIRYIYATKSRYIIHKFNDIHSGKLVKTCINKEITIDSRLRDLKERDNYYEEEGKD